MVTRKLNCGTLEDFSYVGNVDDPTPEETEISQRQAQYFLAKRLLEDLDRVDTYEDKISWLKKTGLCGVWVNTEGKGRMVRFDEKKPNEDYVDRAFRKEIQFQMSLLEEVADINSVLNN
jgi:hypothetical protein